MLEMVTYNPTLQIPTFGVHSKQLWHLIYDMPTKKFEKQHFSNTQNTPTHTYRNEQEQNISPTKSSTSDPTLAELFEQIKHCRYIRRYHPDGTALDEYYWYYNNSYYNITYRDSKGCCNVYNIIIMHLLKIPKNLSVQCTNTSTRTHHILLCSWYK